ncbi:MAG TPA: hypothetical protein DD734_05065 [Firmicutes bacterium]|jgi:stage II sporulation protein AA (anti-sigma F factor antagonist)|nr:hypothetical protein [Bacillota bacterium]HBR33984.1 hypothetical protein [Bacillota bacterium]
MPKDRQESQNRGDSGLNLELKQNGRVLTVVVSGELDLSTSPDFRRRIGDELEQNQGIQHLIFDFKETSFVDSSGLGAILGRYRTIAKRDGKVSAVNVPPHLVRLFELSGLLKVMTIDPSLEEAEKYD